MTDKDFLYWVADRFVHVYNESPHVDFIHKLKKIADKIGYLEKYDYHTTLSQANFLKAIKDAYDEGVSDGKYGP